MKRNMGSFDKIFRILAAVLFVVLIVSKSVTGVLAVIFGLIAAMFIVTSLIGFCPLYVPFKISTLKKK